MKEGFTAEIDSVFIQQATQRATFTGRSRNRELGYLLGIGIEQALAGMPEPDRVEVGKSRITIYVDRRRVDIARELAARADRTVGAQINLLIRMAIDYVTARELASIEEMLQQKEFSPRKARADQANPAPEQTATSASPLVTSA